MNRNNLKNIAVISMLIDHIGLFICNNNLLFRCIGRISFPIFAFFIAEGLIYTSNRRKYISKLSLFAVISQIPYSLLAGFKFNVLFTFLLAIAVISVIEKLKDSKSLLILYASVIMVCLVVLDGLGIIDYGVLGVLLVVILYYVRSKNTRLCLASIILLIMTIKICLITPAISSIIQIFSLVSIPLLMTYDGSQSRNNYKYFFYIFYPSHLMIIYLLLLFI